MPIPGTSVAVRWMVLVAALLFAALSPLTARADPMGVRRQPPTGGPSWQVTITASGTVSASIYHPTQGFSAPSYPINTTGANYLSSGYPQVADGGSISVHRNATYHVKILWANEDGTPALNPPKNVIVRTTSSASWRGPLNKATGSCDNGLGGNKVPSVVEAGESQTFDKYEVKSGLSGVIEYDVSTSASVNVNGPAPSLGYSALTGVGAGISVVAISLTGTVKVGDIDHALIGQGVTGTMYTGEFECSRYNWIIQGFPFQSFVVAPDDSTGTLTPGAGPTNQRQFHCYFSENKTIYLSCEADVVTPSGTLTVSEQKDLVTDAPSYDFTAQTGDTVLELNQSGSDGKVKTVGPGMKFEARAFTPALYLSQGTGQKYFGQLTKYPGSNGWVLDNSWPYFGPQLAGNDPPPLDVMETFDSPSQDLPAFETSLAVSDEYEMYLMYTPPGSDVQDVPLSIIYWQWSCTCQKVSGMWQLNSKSLTKHDAARIYTHPTWTAKFVNIP